MKIIVIIRICYPQNRYHAHTPNINNFQKMYHIIYNYFKPQMWNKIKTKKKLYAVLKCSWKYFVKCMYLLAWAEHQNQAHPQRRRGWATVSINWTGLFE